MNEPKNIIYYGKKISTLLNIAPAQFKSIIKGTVHKGRILYIKIELINGSIILIPDIAQPDIKYFNRLPYLSDEEFNMAVINHLISMKFVQVDIATMLNVSQGYVSRIKEKCLQPDIPDILYEHTFLFVEGEYYSIFPKKIVDHKKTSHIYHFIKYENDKYYFDNIKSELIIDKKHLSDYYITLIENQRLIDKEFKNERT